jgi:hypothetical protein
MTDVTVPVAAAAGAGIGAVIVNLLGVEPQVLLAAGAGAFLGIPFAPPTGRIRAAAVFITVVIASALLGSWAASEFFSEARLMTATKGCSLLIGWTFHPLASVIVAGIPDLWNGLLRKYGLKQ